MDGGQDKSYFFKFGLIRYEYLLQSFAWLGLLIFVVGLLYTLYRRWRA